VAMPETSEELYERALHWWLPPLPDLWRENLSAVAKALG
jgi:hypothetical protein